MAVLPVGIGSEVAAGGYQIERSLRFNAADSAYLSRTQVSGNRRTWTYSFWTKIASPGYLTFCDAGPTPNSNFHTQFYISGGELVLYFFPGSTAALLVATQVFRDVSAWYHIVLAVDTTQATPSNRIKLYVNGAQVTSFSTATYPSQNFDTYLNDSSSFQWIGQYIGGGYGTGTAMNGYIAEYHLIDGSALDPTSFGEYNEDTGVWQPIEYTGSYGTNGVYLNFSDNASTTTLGNDLSGNGNDFATSGFSVTAGAGNDSLVDTPTNYGTDTGVGGEVRGNYATLNPLDNSNFALSEGNLKAVGTTASWQAVRSTIAYPSGSWYVEITADVGIGNGNSFVGITRVSDALSTMTGANLVGSSSTAWAYSSNGNIYNNNAVSTATGTTWSAGAVIGVAFDGSSIKFYKDNSLVHTQSSLTGDYVLTLGAYSTDAMTINFGQRPFAYTAPSGFKALCTQNLPEPTIVDGGEYFNTVLYTGNNTTNSITDVGFQPDFVWIKRRDAAQTFSNGVFDAVRGRAASLITNLTNAEATSASDKDLTAFTSTGFTLGASNQVSVNDNADTYVAWNWKANGAGVSNTAGTITSTVSANTDSGFSIVTYTGTGSAATVGHGLGVAPSMVIVKNRNGAYNWGVYFNSFGAAYLDLTDGFDAGGRYTSFFNGTAPTSSVFSLGTSVASNRSGDSHVAYCFAAIPNYSAFGSYVGNGSSTDGPFVYTGFRPAFLLLRSTSASREWFLIDTSRSPYNVANLYIRANTSAAEGTDPMTDIVSNGFKLRSSDTAFNGSGETYIYMAFAENPFKYSLAR